MVDQDFNYFKKSLKLARENTGKYLSETHSTNYKGKNWYIWGYKFLKTCITKSNTHNIEKRQTGRRCIGQRTDLYLEL